MNFCVAVLILRMEENTQHFWHIILYYSKKGKNATEMQKKDFCSVCGEGAITDMLVDLWIKSVCVCACAHNKILFGNKKEYLAICSNMDG